MSATSSARSSRSNTPNDTGDDPMAADRLAQLEMMLQASMGYGLAEDGPMEDDPTAAAGDMSAELLNLPAEPVVQSAEPAPAEQVAFRLFSTQKAPQTVVIKEAEDDWPSVKDPRIRDVADEQKSVVKERRRRMAALAVDGASIRAEALQQPTSRFVARVTTRRLTQPEATAGRPSLPSLAYFKADIPSIPEPQPTPSTSKLTLDAPAPAKKRRRPPQPKRQELRRPLSALENVPLLVFTLSNSQMSETPSQVTVKKAQVAKKEKRTGNTRLSKARRDLARKKLGKNAKKNKRKKAKAKAKALDSDMVTA